MPKIQGNAVQLHPAAVVFAIIVGGSLAGLLGAILALPMTAAFRDVVRYLFRRLTPEEPEALAASLEPDRDGTGRCLTPIDPYKVLQVDSEAEDEVIQAAYRRLARKYHPDLAATPEAAARMSAINAAWELIGDPAARAAFDRGPCGEARSRQAAAIKPRRPRRRRQPRRGSAGRPSRVRPERRSQAPRAARHGSPRSCRRDWTSGRSSQGGGYDESMHTAQATVPPASARSAIGTCSTSGAMRVGRWARWHATTSSTSSGSIALRSAATIARRSTRILRQNGRRSRPMRGRPIAKGCIPAVAAWAAGRRRGAVGASVAGSRPVKASRRGGPDQPIDAPADRRSLDQQREQDDPEGDLLEQRPLREVDWE